MAYGSHFVFDRRSENSETDTEIYPDGNMPSFSER
jgi:hypothetical protein